MKAITIWQPWASLIAVRAKRFETRSWPTNYRGPIAIHAAAKDPIGIMRMLPTNVQIAAIDQLRKALGVYKVLDKLPLGCVVATAEIVDCCQISKHGWSGSYSKNTRIVSFTNGRTYEPSNEELMFGDWTPGRFAWEIANVKMLDSPIPAKGKQGLWEWEQPLEEVK